MPSTPKRATGGFTFSLEAGAAKVRVWPRRARWGAADRAERSNACRENMVTGGIGCDEGPRMSWSELPVQFSETGFLARQFHGCLRQKGTACQAGAAGWDRGNAGSPARAPLFPAKEIHSLGRSLGSLAAGNEDKSIINDRIHPIPPYLFTVIPTGIPLSPETPWLRIACNRPTRPQPQPRNPITLIPHALLCHFQTNKESCVGQANPNAAMQTSPTIRYLERKKICPAA